MDYRFDGNFRQRARKADLTSQHLLELRRQRVAVRTQETIKDFEEHLKSLQEAQPGVIDELPLDDTVELGRVKSQPSLTRGASDGSGGRAMMRVQSDLAMRTGEAETRLDFDSRPSTPLGANGQAVVASRPGSVLTQQPKEEDVGDPLRSGQCVESRHGAHGFSLLDPIHMPPRSWLAGRETPGRWRSAGDVRSAAAEGWEHRHRRGRTAGPLISEGIKSTAHHNNRASLAFRALDKRSEEASLEQARFERGVFEGRWRDPLLEPSVAVSALVLAHDVPCGFLEREVGEDSPRAEQVASLVLFGLEEALRTSRGNLMSLFRAVNHGTLGVLDPSAFLEGLVRIGIVQDGQLTVEALIEALGVIDPSFDGHVSFTMLERAVAAARSRQRHREKEAERHAEHVERKLTTRYGESLPIDVVKVDRQPKSLSNLERALERFRQQQKKLLAQHGELTQG